MLLRRFHPLYWLSALLWLVYAAMTAFAPIQKPIPFHLSNQTIELLRVSFIIPALIIWLMGTFAFVRLRSYAQVIGDTPDGKGFRFFAYGVGGLLLGYISTTLVGAIKPFYPRTGAVQETLIILSNYLFIWIFLAAFVAMAFGARQLILQTRATTPLGKSVIFSLPIFAITYIWLDLIFSNPLRSSAENTQFVPTYYVSDSLIVMTIVLPSLATWLAAIFCIVLLISYYRRVKGVIYRQALFSFIVGSVGVVASSIFLEILASLGPSRLLGLGYGLLVGLIYLFFLLILVGFGFLAAGSRKLMKIETV